MAVVVSYLSTAVFAGVALPGTSFLQAVLSGQAHRGWGQCCTGCQFDDCSLCVVAAQIVFGVSAVSH